MKFDSKYKWIFFSIDRLTKQLCVLPSTVAFAATQRCPYDELLFALQFSDVAYQFT